MTIKNLAVQVDERLAELLFAREEHQIKSNYARDAIRRAAGQKSDYRTGQWDGDFQTALTVLKNDPSEYKQRPIAEWENQNRQLLQISFEIEELSEVWEEERWTRAFLVINGNGHIHSTTACSTCFPTTKFEWLTAYSADPEIEIVTAAGETACTICYPSAPAEILNCPATIQSKNRAEREANRAAAAIAKAARDAKRIASAPTADGSTLSVPSRWNGRNEEIKTERTAISFWYECEDDIQWKRAVDRTDKTEKAIEAQTIIEGALAGKNGITALEQREILQAKYAKRRKN
jgi:hypothetical protein